MKLPSGTLLQSGVPKGRRIRGRPKANGLFLRGVVMATYVTDDPNHPKALDLLNRPSAVYCDVLTYNSIPGRRWAGFKKVLVSQDQGGLHDEKLWVPRATKTNLFGTLNEGEGANPADMDGDHVLIGFMNDSLNEPIILKALPHPAKDLGNDLYPVGKRLKLKRVDGNPDFIKHNGVFRGVDTDGNFVVDSRFAHSGDFLPGGIEPPPDITGLKGNQNFELPSEATHEVAFYNMASPLTPVEVARFKYTKEVFEILLTFLPTLKVEGSLLDAKLTLGSGAVSATISERLQALWGQLKTWLDSHTHSTGTGPSGAPATPSPAWDATINSGKLTFPDG